MRARSLLCVVALVLAPVAGAEPAPLTPEQDYAAQWIGRQPAATAALEAWITLHPRVARQLFDWDRDHAPRSQFFLGWVVKHPSGGVDGFAATYSDWPVVQVLLRPQQPAIEEFIGWVHAHATAVGELAARPGALSEVGRAALVELHLPASGAAAPVAASPTTPER